MEDEKKEYTEEDLLMLIRMSLKDTGITIKDSYSECDVTAICHELGMNPPSVRETLDSIVAEREAAEKQEAELKAQSEEQAAEEERKLAEQIKKSKRTETWKKVGNAVTYVPRKIGKGISIAGSEALDILCDLGEVVLIPSVITLAILAAPAGIIYYEHTSPSRFAERAAEVYQQELNPKQEQIELRTVVAEAISDYDDVRSSDPDEILNAADTYLDALNKAGYKVDKASFETLKFLDKETKTKLTPAILGSQAARYVDTLREEGLTLQDGVRYLEKIDDISPQNPEIEAMVDSAIRIARGE